jgi:hypothetical protein
VATLLLQIVVCPRRQMSIKHYIKKKKTLKGVGKTCSPTSNFNVDYHGAKRTTSWLLGNKYNKFSYLFNIHTKKLKD